MGAVEGEDGGFVAPGPLSIQSEAQEEILEAYRYYESKEHGLGAEFRRAVEACLNLITRQPRSYAIIEADVRRALLRRFPYGIFYMVEGHRIVVIACFHTSRDPAEWLRRIG